MRLTISEQAIIKCICHAKGSATRQHLVAHTGLDFITVDKCLTNLIITNGLALQPDGGFALTTLTKCNPVVILMQQEMVEERLWMGGGQRHQKLIQRFVDSIVSIIHYRLSFTRRNIQ